jgi:zinc protease
LSVSLRFSAVSILSLSLIASALVQPGMAQSGPAESQPASAAIPKIQFEKYTLPNGLQVILHVDRKLPIVHVNQ